jgi:hypothetical protein
MPVIIATLKVSQPVIVRPPLDCTHFITMSCATRIAIEIKERKTESIEPTPCPPLANIADGDRARRTAPAMIELLNTLEFMSLTTQMALNRSIKYGPLRHNWRLSHNKLATPRQCRRITKAQLFPTTGGLPWRFCFDSRVGHSIGRTRGSRSPANDLRGACR